MTNNDTELTLSLLCKLIKKSLVKILVFALSAVIILSAVLVTVRCFTASFLTEGSITISASDATTSKILTDNKNSALTKVLSDQFGPDADKYLASLSKRLTVTPVTAESKDKEVAVPTQFNVTLSEDKSLKLSKKVYVSIVNSVQSELIRTYVSQVSANLIDPVIGFEFETFENVTSGAIVLRSGNKLISSAKLVRSAMNAALYAAPDSVKTYKDASGKSLTQIYESVNQIIGKIESIRDNLIDYSLVDGAYVDQVIAEMQASLTAEEAKLATAKTSLEKYAEMRKTTVGGTGSVIIPENDEGYISLARTVNNYQANCSALQSSIAVMQSKKNNMGAITAPDGYTVQTANTALTECAGALKTAVSQYESVAKAYNETGSVAENYIANAKHVPEYVVSTLMIVLLDVAAAIIAIIVACGQTFDRMKKAGEFDAETDEEDY